jgi:hypothetical protein
MNRLQQILLLSLATAIFSCSLVRSAISKELPTTAQAESKAMVKKSSSDICHDESSGSYNRTKNFTAYGNMNYCISSGGRAYKGFESSIDLAEQEALDESRSFVTLYNRNDWKHWIDSDKDCQNTRHELLISTSTIPVEFKSDEQCNVLSGS